MKPSRLGSLLHLIILGGSASRIVVFWVEEIASHFDIYWDCV